MNGGETPLDADARHDTAGHSVDGHLTGSTGVSARPAGLAVNAVVVRFGGIRALSGVTLSFPEGKVSALIGPNGAGKSTLINVLTGFQRPSEGSVSLDGQDLTGARPQRITRAGVIRTFQSPRVLSGLSVFENVLLADPGQARTGALAALVRRRSIRRRETAAARRAWEVLERFSLTNVAHHRGGEISGGQQRLVELARMSLRAPRYLILDEPTAGVAPAMRQTMVDHLRRLREDTGACLVLVEHDMSIVEALADEVFVLAEGTLLAHGSMHDIRGDRQVVDAYLGAELPSRAARPNEARQEVSTDGR